MKQVVVELVTPKWNFWGFLAHLFLWLAHGYRWTNIPTAAHIKIYDKILNKWSGFEVTGTTVTDLSRHKNPFAVSRVFLQELYLDDDQFHWLKTYLEGSLKPWPSFAESFSLGVKRFLRIFGFKVKALFKPPTNAEKSCEALLMIIGNMKDFEPLLKKHHPLTIDLCDIMQVMVEGGK